MICFIHPELRAKLIVFSLRTVSFSLAVSLLCSSSVMRSYGLTGIISAPWRHAQTLPRLFPLFTSPRKKSLIYYGGGMFSIVFVIFGINFVFGNCYINKSSETWNAVIWYLKGYSCAAIQNISYIQCTLYVFYEKKSNGNTNLNLFLFVPYVSVFGCALFI